MTVPGRFLGTYLDSASLEFTMFTSTPEFSRGGNNATTTRILTDFEGFVSFCGLLSPTNLRVRITHPFLRKCYDQ